MSMLTLHPLGSDAVPESVAVVRLARRNHGHAISLDALLDLIDRIERIQRRPDARLLVLEGTEDAFCAGLDHRELHELRLAGNREPFARVLEGTKRLITLLALELDIPTIAKVQGPAVGAGFGLALSCDVVVASTRATFGATQVLAGLYPDFGLTHFLHERVGPGLATELCLTGKIFDAHEAQKLGLVSRVAPPHAFEREVGTLATKMSAAPRAVGQALRRQLAERRRPGLMDALERERVAQLAAFESDESLERLAELRARFAAGVGRAARPQ
jgi:enoyl-CoA hydratase/carnithine racemase